MTEVREYDLDALQKKGKQGKSRLKKSLLIFVAILVGVVVIVLLGKTVGSNFFETGDDISSDGPYIATIYVEGTIAAGQTDSFGMATGYQHQWTMDKLDELIADSNNTGLILFVDSPGGGVYESDELYLKLKDYEDVTGRPVYAVMGSMAASGGYYISTAADQIIANRNTWTGSIGVTLGTLYDISDLLERYGVKTQTITSGRNKAMGSSVEPMTDEQRKIFQSLVDEAYDQFTGIVSTERGIDITTVKTIADGRIYTAKQALDLGLVDRLGTLDDAIGDMKDTYELQDCDVIDVVYQDSSLFGSLLGEVKIPNLRSGDVSAILNQIDSASQFPISYECELLK